VKARLDALFTAFGVEASVAQVTVGPTVTRFDVALAPGVRVQAVTALAATIECQLGCAALRIAPVAGMPLLGIEVPNAKRTWVNQSRMPVPADAGLLNVPLGRTTDGEALSLDLADPSAAHLLVAGTTGSGKSSFLNALLTTLLRRTTPEQVQLGLIDPKRVEFAAYRRSAHLLAPVAVEACAAVALLRQLVDEMEATYELLEACGLRNIGEYNALDVAPLPYQVLVVDELADLMLTHRKEVEPLLVRLAQKGRAAGFHLVLATQRPTVDVVPGLLAANLPARLAFLVTTALNSRLVLESDGAEALLGCGDGLYKPVGRSQPVRFQGVHVTDEEITDAVTPPAWPTIEPTLELAGRR
jgi:S-DNA-T family DNA segregation ATPase FtsK/SpoIIIE